MIIRLNEEQSKILEYGISQMNLNKWRIEWKKQVKDRESDWIKKSNSMEWTVTSWKFESSKMKLKSYWIGQDSL